MLQEGTNNRITYEIPRLPSDDSHIHDYLLKEWIGFDPIETEINVADKGTGIIIDEAHKIIKEETDKHK